MAKCGNHGIVVPRDYKILFGMYCACQMTIIEIAAFYGVTHKSVERAMQEVGVPRRRKGARSKGLEHTKKYKREWARKKNGYPKPRKRKDPALVAAKRKATWQRWYYDGPINLNGERQWISKGRALLRRAKRVLQRPSLAASQFPTLVSEPEPTSRV